MIETNFSCTNCVNHNPHVMPFLLLSCVYFNQKQLPYSLRGKSREKSPKQNWEQMILGMTQSLFQMAIAKVLLSFQPQKKIHLVTEHVLLLTLKKHFDYSKPPFTAESKNVCCWKS